MSILSRVSAALCGAQNTLYLLGRFVAQGGTATYRRFVAWLDKRFFAWTVAYAVHPLVILGTMLLLIPLIVFASITSLALILGNYTNVVSASVSSIVLMQTLKHHGENKRLHAESQRMHEEHRTEIAGLHQKLDTLLQQTPTGVPLSPPTPPASTGRPRRTSTPKAAPKEGTATA